MATKAKSKQARVKERNERINFDAFQKACPNFAGRPLKSRRRGGDPPDILCLDFAVKRIGVELVEWLNQEQVSREKPLYKLESEYHRIIRSDKQLTPPNVGQVFIYAKDRKRLLPAKAKAFRKELYRFISAVAGRWPEWDDPQGYGYRDFSGFPMLEEHLESLVFFSRDRFQPYPGVPWIWFELHGGAFDSKWMLDALITNIHKKIKKYAQPQNKLKLKQQRLHEFDLLAYYDQAVLFNTPYRNFAAVAQAVNRDLAANAHPFDKVFLFSPIETGTKIWQVWPSNPKPLQ
jgi:hypothetical protein